MYYVVGMQEKNAADSRQQFILTMAAIGAVFSKNGKQLASNIIRTLSGPVESVDDVLDELEYDQLRIMFGDEKLEEWGKKPKENDGP